MPSTNMGWLIGVAIGFIVVVVAVGIGASIQSDQYLDEACNNYTGWHYNASEQRCDLDGTNGSCAICSGDVSDTGRVYLEGLDGTDTFASKFALIASVLVLVFIIGLLGMLYFKSR